MPQPVYLIIKGFPGDDKCINKISQECLKKYSSLKEYVKQYDVPSAYSLEVVYDDLTINTMYKIINENNTEEK